MFIYLSNCFGMPVTVKLLPLPGSALRGVLAYLRVVPGATTSSLTFTHGVTDGRCQLVSQVDRCWAAGLKTDECLLSSGCHCSRGRLSRPPYTPATAPLLSINATALPSLPLDGNQLVFCGPFKFILLFLYY